VTWNLNRDPNPNVTWSRSPTKCSGLFRGPLMCHFSIEFCQTRLSTFCTILVT